MITTNCCTSNPFGEFKAILIIRKSEYTIENGGLSIKLYSNGKPRKNSVIIQYCLTLPNYVNAKNWSVFYISEDKATELQIIINKTQ